MLQIGMGLGLTADYLWESGLDLTVVDENEIPREDSAGLPRKMNTVRGVLSCLPFEDRAFDYTLINHQLAAGNTARNSDILAEAMRTARYGMIILQWNRLCLKAPDFTGAGSGHAAHPEPLWPWELAAAIRSQCPGMKTLWLSTQLLGADLSDPRRCSGTFEKSLHMLGMTSVSLPLGALLGVRIQWKDIPLDPISVLRRATSALTPAPKDEEVFGREISAYEKNGPAHP